MYNMLSSIRCIFNESYSRINESKTERLSKVKGSFERKGVLGIGGFAKVYLYKWENDEETKIVAVKTLLQVVDTCDKEYVEMIRNEMGFLQLVNHENIVKCFGICNTKECGYGLVLEYCEFGSYRKFFSRIKSCKPEAVRDELWPLKIRMILETMKAFVHLHSLRILHLDLKSDNILLGGNLTIKVSDFGLSKSKTLTHIRNTTTCQNVACGTLGYIAPELYDCTTKPSEKSDIYAFGILVWEILTDEIPYAEDQLHKDNVRNLIIHNNYRPNEDFIPPSAPPYLRTIMKKAWDSDPDNRPMFNDLLKNYLVNNLSWNSISDVKPIEEKAMEIWRSMPLPEDYIPDEKETWKISKSTLLKGALLSIFVVISISTGLLYYFTLPLKPGCENIRLPSQPSKGSVECNFENLPPSCEFTCEPGYKLEGLSRLTCLEYEDGPMWNGTEPYCAKSCDNMTLPSQPIHGSVKCDFESLPPSCEFTCEAGYRLEGLSRVTCLESKDGPMWNGTEPDCKKVQCPVLPNVKYGSVNCTEIKDAHDVCTYNCENGRVPIEASVTCSLGGKWVGKIPTCSCKNCDYGEDCSSTTSWAVLQGATGAIYGKFTTNYANHEIECDVDIGFGGFQLSYATTCKSGNVSVTCKRSLDPNTASSLALAKLLRIQIEKGIFPEPCDMEKFNKVVGCMPN